MSAVDYSYLKYLGPELISVVALKNYVSELSNLLPGMFKMFQGNLCSRCWKEIYGYETQPCKSPFCYWLIFWRLVYLD